MAPFTSLPTPLARSRLKSNLGALALSVFARTLFTPYLALRAALVGAVDAVLDTGKGWDWMWWIETVVTIVLIYNIAEAAYWVQHPQPSIPPTPRGLKLVPVLKSSPLTRSYTSKPEITSTGPLSTPVRNNQQSPLAQSLYRSTPRGVATPERPAGSPALSASTARVLNLSQNGTPSATGLFYDDSTPASPSKVARGAAGAAGATPPRANTNRSDFVVVDREQREWVDNVWKGVRGKGRKVGL